MKSTLFPFCRATVPTKLSLLPIVALLGLFTVSLAHARETRANNVELPMILDSEREALLRKTGISPLISEFFYYKHVVIYRRLVFPEPFDYEPVGLHLDPTLSPRPEKPKFHKVDSGGTSSGGEFVLNMAQTLSCHANKYVLVSARVEKRWIPPYRVSGTAAGNTAKLEELFEKQGIKPKLIAHDFYVLLEAPGQEKPFPYESRPRATQYEIEREAWLVRNSSYTAQGLIYQPTKSIPDAYPKRDVRVRHAAAALAKLTGKEVFVQPQVEKREFRTPKNAGTLETPGQELEALTQQLEKADVAILELNPRSLALVAD